MIFGRTPPGSWRWFWLTWVTCLTWLAVGSLACSSSSAPAIDGGGPDATPRDAKVDVEKSKKDAGDGGVADAAPDADAPFLVELDVTTTSNPDGAPPVALVPAFSPAVHDYYVRCGAGANALDVSMTASPGAESQLLAPTSSTKAPKQTLHLHVDEGAVIGAAAIQGSLSVDYWVRCLPHDFPVLSMVRHPSAGTAPPGYYLVGNIFVPNPAEAGYAMVVDSLGVPLWYYRDPTTEIFNVENVVDGAVSFIPSPSQLPYEIHELKPLQTTQVSPNSTVPMLALDEHEMQVLPNGDYLLIASPLKTGVDLSGLTLPLSDGGVLPLGKGSNIHDCHIVELDAKGTGTVVWEWIGSQHLDPATDCVWPEPINGAFAPDGGAVVDTFHCNSIAVDPKNQNLLVSARQMNSVFYIERATKKILWKMGGSPLTSDNATYVPVPDAFHGQHDARLQPDWTPTCRGGKGQISVFDDETDAGKPARGVVYEVTIDPDDRGAADCGAPGTGVVSATKIWDFPGSGGSAALGSFRISADGSRVIGWGSGSTPGLAFSEVDAKGNRLLDFYIDEGSHNTSYRAIKVPLSAFDRNVLRATAGR
jgi:hypothetical protein